jgi:type 1 fimbriae regulatory protein FimB/type 1 fimbriae regulatory protein FimE
MSRQAFHVADWYIASFRCRGATGSFKGGNYSRLTKRTGERAGLAFPVHAHMLRHACGYALANADHDTRRIQDWLGHRSIQHTTRYTQLSAAPFKDFWR